MTSNSVSLNAQRHKMAKTRWSQEDEPACVIFVPKENDSDWLRHEVVPFWFLDQGACENRKRCQAASTLGAKHLASLSGLLAFFWQGTAAVTSRRFSWYGTGRQAVVVFVSLRPLPFASKVTGRKPPYLNQLCAVLTGLHGTNITINPCFRIFWFGLDR
jgi:hypothetical protein